MTVIITREKIEIDDEGVSYYPYYFDQWWNTEAEDRLVVVKKVLAQWADGIAQSAENCTLYLPYSLNDEEIECFEARVHGDEVVFRCVGVNWNGYSVDLDDLGEFIAHPHELGSEKPENFGTYNKNALVDALRKAGTREV
jgi:hypothetical protein